MGKANLDAMLSSDNQCWNTPHLIRDFIHDLPGWSKDGRGTFTDPCHNENSIMDAAVTYDVEQDGMQHPWFDRAFVNSEYGDALPIWVDECVARWTHYRTEVVGLWPARTDTEFFQGKIMPTASAILFLAGRLTFLGAKDPAPFPSYLPFWGSDPLPFARRALPLGGVLIPRGPKAGFYPRKR